MPWRKLLVPSSGSMIQRGLFGSPSISPPLPCRKPQSGRALMQLVDRSCLLGALIGLRDEIRRPLAADLQVLDLAEIAAQALARLARGLFHDSGSVPEIILVRS
jgi:hypothetical protein